MAVVEVEALEASLQLAFVGTELSAEEDEALPDYEDDPVAYLTKVVALVTVLAELRI